MMNFSIKHEEEDYRVTWIYQNGRFVEVHQQYSDEDESSSEPSYIYVTSGDDWYRKGIRDGLYVIDYSSDGGLTYELAIITIGVTEDIILRTIDENVTGYRQQVRYGTLYIDHVLTETGFDGVEGTDWEWIVSVDGIDYSGYSVNDYMYYFESTSRIIQDQVGSQAFACSADGNIYYTDNNRRTWTSRTFANAGIVQMAHVFANGNVIFADHTKIYLWATKSVAPVEITPVYADGGAPISIHTPVNAGNPGCYYKNLEQVVTRTIGSREMIVWGNYGNTYYGANPVYMFHAFDDGVVKIDYEFGQNTNWTDTGGTASAAQTGGNLLGDVANTTVTRHIHSYEYDPTTSYYYFTTGDAYYTGGDTNELFWFRGTYNEVTDVLTWTKFAIGANNSSHFKSVGLSIKDGYFYWGADITVGEVLKCAVADILTIGSHVQVYNTARATGLFPIDGDMMTAFTTETNRLYCSNDLGANWAVVDLTELSAVSRPHRALRKDANGFVCMASNGHDYGAAVNLRNIHFKRK